MFTAHCERIKFTGITMSKMIDAAFELVEIS